MPPIHPWFRARDWRDDVRDLGFGQEEFSRSYSDASTTNWRNRLRNYYHTHYKPELTAIDPSNTIGRRHYDQIVIFGDSLSDTGNLFNILQGQFPPPPYFQGRFSNGPIWVDQFVPKLGLHPNQVLNFSVGGATTGEGNIASLLAGTNLPTLPGLLTEIDQYRTGLGQHSANPNALHVVFAGGNDFLALPPDLLQGVAAGNLQSFIGLFGAVLQSVKNVATAITELADLGATTIAVANLPNLGRTPFFIQQGVREIAAAFTIGFNVVLEQTLIQLERSLHIDIAQVDLYSLGEAIAQRPQEFGFTDLTNPLIQQVNPAHPEGFFYWDGLHPTTQGHRLIAGEFERALSQPTQSHLRETVFTQLSSLANSGTVRPILMSLLNQVSLPNFAATLTQFQNFNFLSQHPLMAH